MLVLLLISIYATEFLKEIPDARGISLAFSDISENNLNFSSINPSSLPDFVSVNFGTKDFALLAKYYLFGFSLPIKKLKTGILWIRAQVDEVPLYPELPEGDTIPKNKQGEFSNVEEALLLPFKISNFPFAFQFKLISKRFKDLKGKGIGFDLGFKRDFNFKYFKTYIGLSLLDISETKISYNKNGIDKERVKIISFTTFKKKFKPLTLSTSFKFRYDVELTYSAGLEIKIKEIFSILSGFEQEPRFGAGLNFENFSLFYSLRLHELGIIQAVSLSIKK
ncbi:MAG: hypothetical protein ABDH37_03725 [Candidatus Hydrothermales bacterium]